LVAYSHTGASAAISYDSGGSLTSTTSIVGPSSDENGVWVGVNNILSFGVQYQYTSSSEL
jgi:hypothetical protein